MNDNDDIVLQYSRQLCDLTNGHQLETSALLQTIQQLQTALCREKEEKQTLKEENNDLKGQVKTLEQRIDDLQKPTTVNNIGRDYVGSQNIQAVNLYGLPKSKIRREAFADQRLH